MNIASIKWLRRSLLTSIYGLGVLGIVGSGGGVGGFECLPFFNTDPACFDPIDFPPIPP